VVGWDLSFEGSNTALGGWGHTRPTFGLSPARAAPRPLPPADVLPRGFVNRVRHRIAFSQPPITCSSRRGFDYSVGTQGGPSRVEDAQRSRPYVCNAYASCVRSLGTQSPRRGAIKQSSGQAITVTGGAWFLRHPPRHRPSLHRVSHEDDMAFAASHVGGSFANTTICRREGGMRPSMGCDQVWDATKYGM
jgi:hypothetical protein